MVVGRVSRQGFPVVVRFPLRMASHTCRRYGSFLVLGTRQTNRLRAHGHFCSGQRDAHTGNWTRRVPRGLPAGRRPRLRAHARNRHEQQWLPEGVSLSMKTSGFALSLVSSERSCLEPFSGRFGEPAVGVVRVVACVRQGRCAAGWRALRDRSVGLGTGCGRASSGLFSPLVSMSRNGKLP